MQADTFITFKSALLGLVLVALTHCSLLDEPVPKGRIRIKNDSQDSSYNILTVYGGGANYSIKPGEYALMPKGTTDITFIRVYEKYTREYRVRCPRDLTDGISIKLIDVHTARLPGGCETTFATKY